MWPYKEYFLQNTVSHCGNFSNINWNGGVIRSSNHISSRDGGGGVELTKTIATLGAIANDLI
jgi:hypothetical protein